MGDYSNMSEYYDLIMTSGYYDYESIADNIIHSMNGERLLEIGCGTGLILEKILARTQIPRVVGIDLTQSMLNIAKKRLAYYDNVKLYQEDITALSLKSQYDTAFSYGGVWYFSRYNDGLSMISHLPNHAANRQGLAQLAQHITADTCCWVYKDHIMIMNRQLPII